MAKDPVCGMVVDEDKATLKSEYMGEKYYFCAPSCKETFDEDPAKYVSNSEEHTGHGCCCCGGC